MNCKQKKYEEKHTREENNTKLVKTKNKEKLLDNGKKNS